MDVLGNHVSLTLSYMIFSDIFRDPLQPDGSIQLNNKYWPGDKFHLLNAIADAEALVAAGKLGAAARQLKCLRRFFLQDRFFAKFLRRLHRLHSFRSRFGCVTGRLEVADDAIKANVYSNSATRASYPLAKVDRFDTVLKKSAELYRQQYGYDVLAVNRTVRFARPDERQVDVERFGVLSDYHNDEYKGITTIVYLTEVKDENGAFCFIRGSELVPRSLVLTAIHQCVEFDIGLRTPEQLACLPLEFRGSLAIGNFLESEKATVVFRFREVVEGAVGTFVTFGGQYVLHRGGKPTSGSRTAAFFQPEGRVCHKIKSVTSLLFGIIHR